MKGSWVRVPFSAFKTNVTRCLEDAINVVEMPYLSHFLRFGCGGFGCVKMFTLVYKDSLCANQVEGIDENV